MSTSFVEVIARHASQAPLAPAVSDPDAAWNHRELWERSREIGSALAKRGIGPGDLVATALPPGVAHLSVLIGIMATGAAAAPVNLKLAPDERETYLGALRPTLVVTGSATDAGGSPTCSESDLVGAPAGTWTHVPTEPTAPAFVVGTGGTTGTPKGAVWTSGGLAEYLASSALVLEARRTDVELYFASFFHIALATCAMSTLYAGGSVTFEPRFDAGRAVEKIHRGEVTRLFGPPTALDRIIGHPDLDLTRTGSVRSVLFGSTSSEPDLPDRLRAAFPGATLVTGYGATEFGAVTRLRSWESPDGLDGVGWPVPGAALEIVDEHGRPVPDGEVGEVVVRAPWQMAGYLVDGRLEPVADGAIRSGDLAVREADGRIRLRGRLKELVITGGENVFPVEVERVLCDHPAVATAAVVGVADPEWGERVEAMVVLRAPASAQVVDELVRHCRERLVGYKVPKRVVVGTELPLTTAMKVDKRAVKEWLGEH
ncbi:long-chain fatty acid--CoA ligase [Nocardioides marmoriginsengisoli]|uniref:Long-chain fatty acid--CoA ligase n=1 Tax=Nocardioides marmoriginsengisoli TaxID=661483 RepID=A0A3N0CG66_9ACTN|nr:AMP-binding protein [Nocardioides marmoriginsengisoli]RNL62437.1 long-chain fatty acid--CoA ligase [Nocardioides marmoriginsengisoli]